MSCILHKTPVTIQIGKYYIPPDCLIYNSIGSIDITFGTPTGSSKTYANNYSDVKMGAMTSQITSLTIVIQAQIKENIKAPRHWPLCGNSPVTGEFPAQMTSYAENVSIWWRHHVCTRFTLCFVVVWSFYLIYGYFTSTWAMLRLLQHQWFTMCSLYMK